MDDLDRLLTEEAADGAIAPSKPVEDFSKMHISRYAHDKAFAYARLVMENRIGSVEVGGFLTQPRDAKDRVARDAFLARDQRVSRYEYMVDAESVLKAKKELDERGERIVGWWHSHGRLNTFHSEIDDDNQQVILRQIAPSNFVVVPREVSIDDLKSAVEGDELVFYDPRDESTKFRLKLKDGNLEAVAQSLRVVKEKRIGFAYSLVVNHHRWVAMRVPYCEVSTREICHDCGNSKITNYKKASKLHFFEDPRVIDEEALVKEIEEKVNVNGEKDEKDKKYFLPAEYKQRRDEGTLTEPDLGSDFGSDWKIGSRDWKTTEKGKPGEPAESNSNKPDKPNEPGTKRNRRERVEWPGGIFGNFLMGGNEDGSSL